MNNDAARDELPPSLRALGIPPAPPGSPGKIDLLADPAATERLGVLLAAKLRDVGVDVVVSWDEPEDAVLAHIVARELAVRTIQVYMTEGVMDLSDRITSGARVALVADAFQSMKSATAPHGLLSVHDATVVAVVVALVTPELTSAHASGVLVVTPDQPDSAAGDET